MKILIYTQFFFPDVGGSEVFIDGLASEFLRLGHQVTLITNVVDDKKNESQYPYRIIRSPTDLIFAREIFFTDIFLNLNPLAKKISWIIPTLIRKPWCVSTHIEWRIKNFTLKQKIACRLIENIPHIVPSEYMRQVSPFDAEVIYDFYFHEFFYSLPHQKRSKDLVFVGRLVRDKGVDVLISAVKLLRDKGYNYRLTIIGDGPEKSGLIDLAGKDMVDSQIFFIGKKSQAEIADILRIHEVIVIPSRWNESFGIVALEGIACGCIPIGSNSGGLPEAIGDCGYTFSANDPFDLAEKIKVVLSEDGQRNLLRNKAQEHLRRFRRRDIAEKYLSIMYKAVQRK